ncbi:MAG: hypothetical protein ACREEM_41860, partial [Blastocatellia bacterium]
LPYGRATDTRSHPIEKPLYCVFRRITGIRLGFDIERGIPQWIGTAMGDFLTYGHEASLDVLGIETVAMVYFAAEEHFNRNILGRIGLLDRVRFGLVDHDSRLYLSDYNDPV